ncbi:MAG: GGDEF domain-containing protein [Terriglobia bacterium]
MRVFDRIDPANLDRRELQLWLLAIGTIVIMATGMALLMYPAVFSSPVVVAGPTVRKAFFGFCALSILLVAYLLDRHFAMRQLRRQLTEEQLRNLNLRQQASADLLKTLPEFDHFRDRLPMEVRRAMSTSHPLSLVLVRLQASRELSDPSEIWTAFGDAAKSMIRRLRREDSIYRFSPEVFGILLPGANADSAYRVADRLAEGLSDASGASDRFTFETHIVNYPEHTDTAWDMEQAVRVFFAQNQLTPPGLTEEAQPAAA